MSTEQAILVAPDAFKGTFSALEVAEAIGRGLRSRQLEADLCPLADGGEGTAAAISSALGGRVERAGAHDPLGRRIEAGFTLLAGEQTAIVEVASASGLALLEPAEYDAEGASSYGTGELIAAAAAGTREVIVAAGGSASSDGGAGALGALAEAGGIRGAELIVLCDVRTPWERAAARFGPQKGADAAAVESIEDRLDALAARLPRDPRGVPMTGCAGGLSGALWAHFGARLMAGAGRVMEAVGFDLRLGRARAVITGEGRLDEQSFEGKVALSAGACADAPLAGVKEAGTLDALEAAAAAFR